MNRKNMLDFILDARLENIDDIKRYDLERLTQRIDESKSFENLMDYIDGILLPINTRLELLEKAEECEYSISNDFDYFTTQYYKLGFSDAVNMIFDAKEYKNKRKY